MVLIQKTARGNTEQFEITIPRSIAKAKGFEGGEEVDFKIADDGRIYIEEVQED